MRKFIIATALIATPIHADVQTHGNWQTHVTKDPFDDTLYSTSQISTTNGGLAVGCREAMGSLIAVTFISKGEYVGIGEIRVLIRFDDNPASTSWWYSGGLSGGIYPVKEDDRALFIYRLKTASKLMARFEGQSNPVTMSFDLTGASDALSTTLGICGRLPPE
jgi:hypothetical protein